MSRLHKPPHPDKTLRDDILHALKLSVTEAVEKLGGCSPYTICVSKQYLEILGLVQTSIASLNLSKQEAYIGAGALPKQSGVFVRIMCRSGQPVQQLVSAISQQLRTYILTDG